MIIKDDRELKTDKLTEKWIKNISNHLVGRTIKKIDYWSTEEADYLGWYTRPVVIELDNGTYLYPMSYDEGNNGGAIGTNIEELPILPVMRF